MLLFTTDYGCPMKPFFIKILNFWAWADKSWGIWGILGGVFVPCPCFPLKFIYSEKATQFCEISTLLLTVCTVVKSKMEISQNFVAFSEYMNFNRTYYSHNFRPMMSIYGGIQVQKQVRPSWAFPFRSPRTTLSTTTIESNSNVWPL